MGEDKKPEGKKKEEKPEEKPGREGMEVNVERIYTIPLHPERGPRWRRSELAIFHIRDYLVRHMKARPDEVHIDSSINEHVFSRGARKPPRHIRVRAMKFEDGIVEAELKQD